MKTKPSKPTESWLEYLEEELDPSLRADYSKLLENSKADAKTLEDLKRLRASIKRTDPFKKADFNDRLFGNIMAEVQKTQIHPRWRLQVSNPKIWGPIAASVMLVIGLTTGDSDKVIEIIKGSESIAIIVESSSDKMDWLVQESSENPELLTQAINSHRTDEDLALYTLAQRAENMSDDELALVMDKLLQ